MAKVKTGNKGHGSKKDKIGIFLGFGVSLAVLVTMYFYLSNAGEMDVLEMAEVVLVLLMVAGATLIILKRAGNVKENLPATDEMARKQEWKAGSYAYLASVWVAVGALWLSDVFSLTVEHVVGLVVLIPGIVFIGLSLYFGRKGDVE